MLRTDDAARMWERRGLHYCLSLPQWVLTIAGEIEGCSGGV